MVMTLSTPLWLRAASANHVVIVVGCVIAVPTTTASAPASRAARSAADEGKSPAEVLRAAADAANKGAEATVDMTATKGRASYLGERSVGHKDPGATSSAYFLAEASKAVDA